MALSDFATRMFGYNPFDTNSSGQPIQLPGATMANASTIAQPTLEQSYQDDLRQAQMDRVGNLGMLLLAAGQQLTPAQRATILSQAPQYMDGAQRDAMTAAQARLYGMQQRASQEALARQDELRKQAPALAKQLNLSEADLAVLSPEQIQKMRVDQLTRDPRESQLVDLKLQHEQAQIDALRNPRAGNPQLVDMPDGGKGMWYPGSTSVVPVEGTGQGAKPPTQDQATSAGFVTRMRDANSIMSDPKIAEYGMGIKGTMNRANSAFPIIGNAFVDPQYQQLDQSQRDFINATLRRESGASISPGEFENARIQYFPQVGDSPEVIKQKENNRQNAIKGVLYATTPQFQKEFGDIAPQRQQLPEGVTSIRKVR